ncbi:protein of unknown function [Acidithiobacillus ferrivorans]|uniref:Uncharacterized protein n=1 Tax=Acidithiobacillus ferrivorans TaxID=160808 RepID=A0ABY1MRX2_9PROT|nr:protein of unknown function [Acidithiobacillus ferrivorans]
MKSLFSISRSCEINCRTRVARLSQRLGSNYKADCWIVVRCSEVKPLSAETVQQYINMMVGEIVCQENDRRTQITPNIEVRFA